MCNITKLFGAVYVKFEAEEANNLLFAELLYYNFCNQHISFVFSAFLSNGTEDERQIFCCEKMVK